ncbi:cell division topological specificity factor MinE [Candidatus Ishikawella capsulata]|uniref:Cell division topological specificity factor n=1 Tax=Candidatus Ishikawaella capsulata Mpkobe TaxID=476281 RepID=C5WCM7_9ENTR|nr:cell division topological specificity factor MinE [Candidatus Ishikawaella capsulata]BAH83083.1 cell division topological specificity factor MinE [Candidatus Ishikawaella capsulata Mpkobe]
MIINFLSSRKKNTAETAKKRLQFILIETKKNNSNPPYIPELKRDILEVICKYINIKPDMISIHINKTDKNIDTVKMNIVLSKF